MTPTTLSTGRVRHQIRVTGVVQGVGFRPFVHRLAVDLDLAGHVGNDTGGVFLEIEGRVDDVIRFEDRLVRQAPPLARIYEMDRAVMVPLGEVGFSIVDSRAGAAARTFVSPDIAVCDDCLAELFDPADQRFRYPFINCTNCGPRFTITVRLPYDRPNTTMARFPLCADCAREYANPADRRFHAQPVACPVCGPRVGFVASGGSAPAVVHSDAAIAAAQEALARGEIVATKGLGGYHLACDATSEAAVRELRRRKGRPAKPFAVMVADVEAARRLAHVHDCEAALLTSPQRPIVLLSRRPDTPLTQAVAPENPWVGVLLPYTPLHHLLFRGGPSSSGPAPEVLVMTSGNLADEPICYDDEDARQRLKAIADSWLIHDRPIHVPCDDSVVRVAGGQEVPIRRSRGYAPLPIRLPAACLPTLATGAELKNTFCLASGRDAWISQHIGDMGSVETLAAFERSVAQFADMYGVRAERLAADLHPDYHTRHWAEDHSAGRQVELVQHHHAHIASVMVEHGLTLGERVIGFAFDGTGYGADGASWGGEVLIAGYDGFERAAHLRYVPLPGGDAAVRKPYRSALAHLWAAGIDWAADLPPVRAAPAGELTGLQAQLRRGRYCPATSSMGRLFDAVSSLLGYRHTVSYEAQAAIELERMAGEWPGIPRPYQFTVEGDQIDPSLVLRAIVEDWRRGCPAPGVAAGFHLAVAHLVATTAERLGAATGIDRIALSGGVFQNVRLLGLVRAELARRHLTVLTHRVVPPNDGGLAIGQAAVAGARAAMRSAPPIGGEGT